MPRSLPFAPLAALMGAVCLGIACAPVLAGVQFENCVKGADGSITCDTVPTGNTLLDDEAARFGLLQNASPGWSEFDPYGAYDDEFGGNQG